MNRTRWSINAVAAVAISTAAVSAGTPSLISIGVLDPNAPQSGVNAITPDGQLAVGYSVAPNSNQTATIRHPVFWSAVSGLVQLPNPALLGPGSDIDGEARGIVYRPLHPAEALGISGSIAEIKPAPEPNPDTVQQALRYYKAPLAAPASGVWQTGDPDNALSEIADYNASRMQESSAGGAESWYIVGHRRRSNGANIHRGYRIRIDPIEIADWYALYKDSDGECEMVAGDSCCPGIGYGMGNSVDAEGRAVGYDDGNSECSGGHRALWFPMGDFWGTVIPGGSRLASEAVGVSRVGGIVSGYDASAVNEDLDPVASRAFLWRALPPQDAAMRLLDNLPGDAMGCAIAVTANETAGGYSSDGTNERAVIWDKNGMWDSTGQPKLLMDLLVAQGVNVSAWTKLTRITSMSDNAQTVAGWGVWAADGSTRGFIAVSGNSMGACCVRSGLGAGTCIPDVTPGVCAAQGGQYMENASCGMGNANCNFCGSPWADTDFDQDVDMDDFGVFQACFGVSPISIECACLDKAPRTPAGIDVDDFKEFLDCATGPNVPYVTDPNCES